jgi:hypothetical protein
MLQYNFSLRSASQQGGLLSLLSKLCAVLSQREKYISKFLKNSTQLLDRLLLLCVYYSTGAILCLPAP